MKTWNKLDKNDKHIQSNKYLHRFFNLRSAEDLFHYHLFPNAKEVSESFAVLNAVFEHFSHIDRNSNNVDLVCIGDGKTPRTSGLFSFLTKWNCYSIDPELDINRANYSEINRLKLYPNKVEDLKLEFKNDIGIVVSLHSHADIDDMWNVGNWKEKYMVHVPCCKNKKLSYQNPYLEYVDIGMHSPKNKIFLYKNI